MRYFALADNGLDKIAVTFGFNSDDPKELEELRQFLQIAVHRAPRGSKLEARLMSAAESLQPLINQALEAQAASRRLDEVMRSAAPEQSGEGKP